MQQPKGPDPEGPEPPFWPWLLFCLALMLLLLGLFLVVD